MSFNPFSLNRCLSGVGVFAGVVAFDGTAQKMMGPKTRDQSLITQEKPLSFMELNILW